MRQLLVYISSAVKLFLLSPNLDPYQKCQQIPQLHLLHFRSPPCVVCSSDVQLISGLNSAALLPRLMSCKKGATRIMHRAPPGTSVPLRRPGYLPARPKNLPSLLVLLLVVLLPHEVHGPAAPGVVILELVPTRVALLERRPAQCPR